MELLNKKRYNQMLKNYNKNTSNGPEDNALTINGSKGYNANAQENNKDASPSKPGNFFVHSDKLNNEL